MSYTVHQAKTNLSRLIKEVESGKEVIIRRGKVPVAKLVAIEAVKDADDDAPTGQVRSATPVFDPMTDEELAELGLD
jgi:prevent-host-death family protein